MYNLKKIEELLIQSGKKLLNNPSEVNYASSDEANALIRDLENYSHVFVLACIMDRQIKAERAWDIPYKLSQIMGGFEFSRLLKLDEAEIREIFVKNKFHRFNNDMAKNFYLAVQRIQAKYNGNASLIWKDKPKSATVVLRFLQFEGVGIKIASMAANLLARDYKIPLADYICIDISPDTHIKRTLRRMGFVSKNADATEITYKAREIYPKYPGILDNSCFEIGRNWCKAQKPLCEKCYLNKYCPKIID